MIKWVPYVQAANTLALAFCSLYFGLVLIPAMRQSDVAHREEREQEMERVKTLEAFHQRQVIQNAEILSKQRLVKRELEDVDRLLDKIRSKQ